MSVIQSIVISYEIHSFVEIHFDDIELPVCESEEAKLFEEKIRHILEETYINPSQIPESPAEPNEILMEDEANIKEIPLEDQTLITEVTHLMY